MNINDKLEGLTIEVILYLQNERDNENLVPNYASEVDVLNFIYKEIKTSLISLEQKGLIIKHPTIHGNSYEINK